MSSKNIDDFLHRIVAIDLEINPGTGRITKLGAVAPGRDEVLTIHGKFNEHEAVRLLDRFCPLVDNLIPPIHGLEGSSGKIIRIFGDALQVGHLLSGVDQPLEISFLMCESMGFDQFSLIAVLGFGRCSFWVYEREKIEVG